METLNRAWVSCYHEFAEKLLNYKNDRKTLISLVESVYRKVGIKLPTLEKDNKIIDIDPFTVFGLFNKNKLTDSNRQTILSGLAESMGMAVNRGMTFYGIPTLNNMNATFYYFVGDRGDDDIDNLWDLFEAALKYAADDSDANRSAFCSCYDTVIGIKGINNSKLTMGLYWLAADSYLNLDNRSQWYIYESGKFPESVVRQLPEITPKMPAETYLTIMRIVRGYVNSSACSLNDFVELSYAAWSYSTEINMRKKAEAESLGDNALGDDAQSVTRYWLYAPGHNADRWERFYARGIMAIGWGELGDLKSYPDKNAIKNRMKELYGEEYSYRNDSHATWQFANEISKGDVIFVKKGVSKIIGKGIVDSDYMFDASVKDGYNHVRKVKWLRKGEWDAPGNNALKTLTEITDYKEYVVKLNDIFDGDDESSDEAEKKYAGYGKSDFLQEVFMTESEYDTLKRLILYKKNIILRGAPGVGKTFAAKRLAYSIMGEKDTGRVMMVQFHQSYSYEDFIMGYRPTEAGTFRLNSGPFYNFCKRAESDDSSNPYFFIIDEINRGNISKIFGELFLLIESDKRGVKLPLLYGEEEFSVPGNVYIIGMMNTADRSLAMLDYALMRRFAYYEMTPAFENERFIKYREEKANDKFDRLIKAVEEINLEIEEDASLGRGFRIGHSYFCTNEEIDDEWLASTVKFEIMPLLEEYWFDDRAKVRNFEKKLTEAIE